MGVVLKNYNHPEDDPPPRRDIPKVGTMGPRRSGGDFLDVSRTRAQDDSAEPTKRTDSASSMPRGLRGNQLRRQEKDAMGDSD